MDGFVQVVGTLGMDLQWRVSENGVRETVDAYLILLNDLCFVSLVRVNGEILLAPFVQINVDVERANR